MWWRHLEACKESRYLSMSTEVFLHFNNYPATLGQLYVSPGLPVLSGLCCSTGNGLWAIVPSIRGKVAWAGAG